MSLSKVIDDCEYDHYLNSPNCETILKSPSADTKIKTKSPKNGVTSSVKLELHKDLPRFNIEDIKGRS